MKIIEATYKTSVVHEKNLLSDKLEFAFVGRSNVGKSSFINNLTNKKNLAKTSSMPGRTRMINYFEINKQFYFVDLPGYGYHKAGKQNEIMWASLMEKYLSSSQALKRVFMLVDIRHNPTELDERMLKYLTYEALPFCIVATKCDKIAKSKINAYLDVIAKKLHITKNNIVAYSSETGLGKDKILQLIQNDIDEVQQNTNENQEQDIEE